jgi:hypothetical protein
MMAPLLIGWSQDTFSAVADFTTAFGSRGLSGGPAPGQIQNFLRFNTFISIFTREQGFLHLFFTIMCGRL